MQDEGMAVVVRGQYGGLTTVGNKYVLDSPFGYYMFLGVSKTASTREIEEAHRRLVLRFHPDKGGTDEDFQNLARVAETLLDDSEPGQENRRRAQYDKASEMDEYFDGTIKGEKGDTVRISDFFRKKAEAKRERAETDFQMQSSAEYKEAKQALDNATNRESVRELGQRLTRMVLEARGIPEPAVNEILKVGEEVSQRKDSEEERFVRGFGQSDYYFSKILDAIYNGDGLVVFGTERRQMRIGLGWHEEKDDILEMGLGGDCYLTGFKRVHFKSEKGRVRIMDPNIEGIFHVINGSVEVDYRWKTYRGPIRARAPSVEAVGFERRGDLFIQTSQATENWWERKPVLDIAVKEGSVKLQADVPQPKSLQLQSQSGPVHSDRRFNEVYGDLILENKYEIIITKNKKRENYSDW